MSREIRGTFRVGVSREDITPEAGIQLSGYSVRVGPSLAVQAPLTLTALVVEGGNGARVAILALDWIAAFVPFVSVLRQRCASALGVAAKDVLINFSHSHSTPTPPGWSPYGAEKDLIRQEEWAKQVADAAVRACVRAASELRPGRIATGWGECRANVNRRQRMDDGAVLLGEDPTGPSDHGVGVARIDDLEGRPIALVYRFSCHTVTLGPRTNAVSPDFIGPARSLIESQFGCCSLFLQGCAGNQNPVTGIGQDAEGCEDTVRIGQMLGGEVVKVAAGLRTHRRRRQPRLVRSIAVYWLFEYEAIPVDPPGTVYGEEVQLSLPLVPLPPACELLAEVEDCRRRLRVAADQGVSDADRSVSERFLFWAERRVEVARGGPDALRVNFPVQCLRIGSWTVLGLPFEPMAETGERLRASSPGGEAWILGYSNGVVSYLPTPEVSAEGGMEAKLGYKAFLLPSEVPGSWEPIICAEALKMMRRS